MWLGGAARGQPQIAQEWDCLGYPGSWTQWEKHLGWPSPVLHPGEGRAGPLMPEPHVGPILGGFSEAGVCSRD